MSDGKKKLGRPYADDRDGEMARITFRVDAETKAALEKLEKAEGPNIRGRRSIVLRKLILEAVRQLSDSV
jgi:hypothetical protein